MDPLKYEDPKDYVLDIAKHKADVVYSELNKLSNQPDVVISADSLVVLNNKIFGKPKDKNEAVEYLNL